MSCFRKIFLSLIIIVSTCLSSYAENWQDASMENRQIYVDTDSVKIFNEYTSMGEKGPIFYNVKYYDKNIGEYIFASIKAKNVTNGHSEFTYADITCTCKFSQYSKNKSCTKTQAAKTSSNSIRTESLLYNANEIVKNVIYDKEHPSKTADAGGINSKADWGSYMSAIEKGIKLKWHPPEGSGGKSATVLFRINRQGNVISCKMVKSSGDRNFDYNAVDTVRAISHGCANLKKFPTGFIGNYVDIQFTFDLKEK